MTKKDFIARAVISMASNSRIYFDAYQIVALAIKLADECEERFSYGFFDDPSETDIRGINDNICRLADAIGEETDEGENICDVLSGIRYALNEIRDYIGSPEGCGNLSTLQEMVCQIDKIREKLMKL